MGFTPKWGACWDCGAPIWKTAAKKIYCQNCLEVHKETQKLKNRKRAMQRYYANRPEPPGTRTPHRCYASNKCLYGDYSGGMCHYFSATGKLRTSGGKHRIVNGKCDLFMPRPTHGRKSGWKAIQARIEAEEKA